LALEGPKEDNKGLTDYGDSAALAFIKSQGWQWRPVDSIRIELETCCYCHKDGYGHLYFEVHPTTDTLAQRDGLFQCHRCGRSGNLTSLKKDLGFAVTSIESKKEWAGKKIDPLPDVEVCHQALLDDEDALEYLLNGRGFSLAIIQDRKLGLTTTYFRGLGDIRAIVYPYLVGGNCVWAKFRSLPTMPLNESNVAKSFACPSGYDSVLYNGEILHRTDLKEVILMEGEADCIAALDKGVTNVCGVPGANIKKAEWIDTLDHLNLETIYICYDMDKVGQKAAQSLASRIGLDKCKRIAIPSGKDINEWFTSGGTLEAFNKLKEDAELFDVDGVLNTSNAVQEFVDELLEKGSVEPKYKTQWPTVNSLVGFDEGDVIDILAPEKIGKTTLGMNIMEHMVDTYGEDGIIICLEMTRSKMAKKWIAMISKIEDNIPKNAEQSRVLMNAFLDAAPIVQAKVAARDGDLYFCYPKYKSVDDIYNLMRDCIRRYGVKWIMIDNLQRLCDTTIGSKNRMQHLSEISKVTSQIAKDHKIQMIRILQPHRVREGQMVNTDNVDGSSQIGKDCDCMITIHRERLKQGSLQEFQAVGYIQGEGTFSAEMVLTVGLSRYSIGGHTTLFYDGARSLVTEVDKDKMDKTAAKVDIGYEAQLKRLGINPAPLTAVQEVIAP
jgi:5S rRNA maturation endonuclease (ribonuclease M5)